MIEEQKLAKIVGYSAHTLKIYLCRPEFNHIERVNVDSRTFVYKGITKEDITKLQSFKRRKRARIDSGSIANRGTYETQSV